MAKAATWISAFRLRTLPLAFSCILMGAVLAYMDGYFQRDILIWSLITTLFLQILSNLANDYGDAASGVDSAARKGPKRTVSSGEISKSAMKRALILFAGFSLLSGLYLIWLAFGNQWINILIFLLIGLGAIWAAIKYTVGKRPYGYAGLGDLFVWLFFGLVGVGGSYFLYSGFFEITIVLPAATLGFFSVGVLNINNIRDIVSDEASGKKSIPVRLGRKRAVVYHWLLLISGLACILLYGLINQFSLGEYLFCLTIPLLFSNAWGVKNRVSETALDPYLKQLALTTLIFVILFGVGQLFFG